MMEEQLKLILVLREEINELISDRDITNKEYNDLVELFYKIFDSMQNESKQLENLQLRFRNAKDSKIIKCTGMISCTIMAITFFLLKTLTKCQLYDIVLVEGFTLTFTSAIPICLASTIFDSIIEKHLVKKYPNIEKLYSKVNSLNKDVNLKEQELAEIRSKKEVLDATIKGIENKLARKKEELYSLEEEYFNSFSGKNTTFDEENEMQIGIAGKSKKKIRIP